MYVPTVHTSSSPIVPNRVRQVGGFYVTGNYAICRQVFDWILLAQCGGG